MEAEQAQGALVEVERALQALFGGSGRREETEAAHRFLQAFQKQHPLAWSCSVVGLTAVLASPDAHASSPLPLFLAQTLAHLARKAWAGGGLGAGQLEQAAGLMVRCCQLQGQGVQQLATQLGLAVCAGVMACPRVAPGAVFGETMALVERAASVDDAGAVAEARLKLLQLLPEEALRNRSLSIPVERRRAVLRVLAAGDGSAARSPAAQALHHLTALQPPSPVAFAAMRAWLELDFLPWDAVLAPWLPRALELAHAAVGQWAATAEEGEEAELLAASSLELLAGVIAPSEAGEDGGPAVGSRRGGAAAQEESVRLQRHRRRQSIEAGAAILPFLPHLWSAITRHNSTLHRLDSPVGHAALRLIVDVGMAGLERLEPIGEEQGGREAEQHAIMAPLYRDPSTVLMPLLAATTAAPLPAVTLALEFWQALGNARPAHNDTVRAAIDAAALQFLKAAVRRSTFPSGYPEALSLADRQAFVDFREEVREAMRGVVGSGREGSKARGQAIATALMEELWRLSSAEGAQEVFPIESVVHALSALGKDLPALLSDEALTRLVTALPLLPLHPAIVRSGALLLSTLPDWLTSCHQEGPLDAALRSLLASLAFSESEREPFPLKSKQDHAGVVALLKLSHAAGSVQLAAVPGAADQLVAAYHSACQCPPSSASPPLEPRSQLLLLEAINRVVIHGPGAVQLLEALCAPMWAAVAAAVAASSLGDPEEEEEKEGPVSTELRRLATVVRAAGGGARIPAEGIGALAMCFLARGEGVRSLLAYDSHRRAGWTRGAIALTAALLRALGRAGVGGEGAASSSPALLEGAYHQCLQGWAPTVLQQVAAASSTSVALLPSFLVWAEAALLSPISQNSGDDSPNTAALTAAVWEVYARVARRCGEVLLALKRGNGSSEAREELAAAFFASFGRLLPFLSSSSLIGPLLAHDPVLLPLALQAAMACLDAQGREAGKAVCAFVRQAATTAGESAGGVGDEPATALRRLFVEDARANGWEQQQQQPEKAANAGASSPGMRLTLGLLTGVCGTMPSWLLDDLIAALASLFRSFGAETAGGWMAAAIAHPTFPRAHVSEQARKQFLGQIARCVLSPVGGGLSDPQQLRAFKTSIKAHCGGKKKGTTGTPASR